ncbi:hypothetical protein Acr_04g0002230 [Actinidia rufa]|uniref:CCHC-type domain-containing protein n=1 Tax=Actinidia rufa TaxID=165716 RepID=A0A7J0EG91_9ERIC|nr:hypothetical protein Acr_04g0002230 [Actinidia rufa]
MAEGSDLVQHVNLFNQIISNLLRIDVKFDEEDRALMLLTFLPSSYEHLVTTLIWGKETLEIEEVTTALLAYNQRKQNIAESSQGEGLVVNGNQDRGQSKGRGQSVTKNSRSQSRNRKNIKCFKCHEKGHMKKDCPKWKKGKGNEKKKGEASNIANVAVENSDYKDGDMLSVSSNSDHYADSWILDSACSYHMSPNREWFDTYRSVNYGSIIMGNDASCRVIGIGTIKIKMCDGVVRILCDVRHNPELRKNLISLGTLDSNGYGYKSEGGVLKVIKCALIIMKGQKVGGNIYILLGRTFVGGVNAATKSDSKNDDTLLWHMRDSFLEVLRGAWYQKALHNEEDTTAKRSFRKDE